MLRSAEFQAISVNLKQYAALIRCTRLECLATVSGGLKKPVALQFKFQFFVTRHVNSEARIKEGRSLETNRNSDLSCVQDNKPLTYVELIPSFLSTRQYSR